VCNPASFVLTKDAIFWSMKTDSHEEIVAEHKLHADGVRGPNVLRVEIAPPASNRFDADPEAWRYKVDQDLMPPWFDAKECEARTRAALLEWISARVIREKAKRECRDGVFFAHGSSKVTACDSSEVTAYGSSEVTACDSSKVTAHDSSKVTAYDSSKVTACDSHATARLYHSSKSAAPTGPYAVVIDCRGDRAVCITEETAKKKSEPQPQP
jgi:hypothetical protein